VDIEVLLLVLVLREVEYDVVVDLDVVHIVVYEVLVLLLVPAPAVDHDVVVVFDVVALVDQDVVVE